MTVYSNHAGIHLSTTKLQIIEISCSKNNYYLENADEEYFDNFLKFTDKETKFITVLQNAFNVLIQRHPLKSNKISFSIPSNVFKVFQIPFEEALRKKDLLRHIKWELKVLYPNISVDDYTFQTVRIKNSTKQSSKQLMIFALSKEILRSLHKFCERNNLEMLYVDNELLTVNNVVTLSHLQKQPDNYLLYLLRDNYSVLALFENSKPAYYSCRKIQSLKNIVDILGSDLDKLSVAFDYNLDVEKAFVTGANVNDSLLGQINKAAGLNFTVVNSFKRLNVDTELQSLVNDTETNTKFSAAAGVAYRLF